jgi:hypothetical protein
MEGRRDGSFAIVGQAGDDLGLQPVIFRVWAVEEVFEDAEQSGVAVDHLLERVGHGSGIERILANHVEEPALEGPPDLGVLVDGVANRAIEHVQLGIVHAHRTFPMVGARFRAGVCGI